MFKKKSLQGRVFMYMILTTVVAFVLVMSTTLYQYNLDLKNYHLNKLNRKETALKRHINYVVSNNMYFKEGANIDSIFSDKRIFEFNTKYPMFFIHCYVALFLLVTNYSKSKMVISSIFFIIKSYRRL